MKYIISNLVAFRFEIDVPDESTATAERCALEGQARVDAALAALRAGPHNMEGVILMDSVPVPEDQFKLLQDLAGDLSGLIAAVPPGTTVQ